jgi:hypothetical protein
LSQKSVQGLNSSRAIKRRKNNHDVIQRILPAKFQRQQSFSSSSILDKIQDPQDAEQDFGSDQEAQGSQVPAWRQLISTSMSEITR